LEVFVPFKAFTNTVPPRVGAKTVWYKNFTRHRVAEWGLSPTIAPLPGSKREYQRLHTTFAAASNNLNDFVPIQFTD
jgi:hypothetical protein